MQKWKPVDHTTMREMNLALILNVLRLHAPISRAGLASMTSLNKATVSSLVKELLTRGLVHELGVDTTSNDIGRPAINLELNPEAGYIVGAEIGVDFILVIVTNFAAEILARRYESTLRLDTQEAILSRMIKLLKDSHQEVNRHDRPIFGIGLGVPGLVDVSTGTLLFAPNLGWSDVSLRELLEREFNVPVFVDNEANMAALGETYFGAGQDRDYVLYINIGVGLGGGIVLNGQLLLGAAGFAGEVGHMTMDPNGHPCNCGNRGCWETLVSQRAIFRYIEDAILSGQPSSLAKATGGNFDKLTVSMIVEAAKQGDSVALQALQKTGYWLGIGLANLINALNPDRVVVGGTLSLGHEFLLPIVNEIVAERALRWSRETTEIVIAAHGADACVMGGIATVYRKILSKPTGWMPNGPDA
jgi:glucokinase-like ROK family protein